MADPIRTQSERRILLASELRECALKLEQEARNHPIGSERWNMLDRAVLEMRPMAIALESWEREAAERAKP